MATQARIYRPKIGSNDMDMVLVSTNQGKLQVAVTETPLFVVPGNAAPNAGSLITSTALLYAAIQVYPNPTGSFVTVQTERRASDPILVNVFDAGMGRLHRQVTIAKSGEQFSGKIDLSQLPIGIYLLEITQGSERVIRKVIKSN